MPRMDDEEWSRLVRKDPEDPRILDEARRARAREEELGTQAGACAGEVVRLSDALARAEEHAGRMRVELEALNISHLEVLADASHHARTHNAMAAHVERLRNVVQNGAFYDPEDRKLRDEALAATPAQSLAAFRAEVLEEAAKVAESLFRRGGIGSDIAERIRALAK